MLALWSESVFSLWKEAGVPGEKNHGELARNRQTETSQEFSPFPAGDLKATINRRTKKHRLAGLGIDIDIDIEDLFYVEYTYNK